MDPVNVETVPMNIISHPNADLQSTPFSPISPHKGWLGTSEPRLERSTSTISLSSGWKGASIFHGFGKTMTCKQGVKRAIAINYIVSGTKKWAWGGTMQTSTETKHGFGRNYTVRKGPNEDKVRQRLQEDVVKRRLEYSQRPRVLAENSVPETRTGRFPEIEETTSFYSLFGNNQSLDRRRTLSDGADSLSSSVDKPEFRKATYWSGFLRGVYPNSLSVDELEVRNSNVEELELSVKNPTNDDSQPFHKNDSGQDLHSSHERQFNNPDNRREEKYLGENKTDNILINAAREPSTIRPEEMSENAVLYQNKIKSTDDGPISKNNVEKKSFDSQFESVYLAERKDKLITNIEKESVVEYSSVLPKSLDIESFDSELEHVHVQRNIYEVIQGEEMHSPIDSTDKYVANNRGDQFKDGIGSEGNAMSLRNKVLRGTESNNSRLRRHSFESVSDSHSISSNTARCESPDSLNADDVVRRSDLSICSTTVDRPITVNLSLFKQNSPPSSGIVATSELSESSELIETREESIKAELTTAMTMGPESGDLPQLSDTCEVSDVQDKPDFLVFDDKLKLDSRHDKIEMTNLQDCGDEQGPEKTTYGDSEVLVDTRKAREKEGFEGDITDDLDQDQSDYSGENYDSEIERSFDLSKFDLYSSVEDLTVL